MINTKCPSCGQKVRAHEYTRKRESYMTNFACPHCGTQLQLASELYLWVVLIFQIIPVSILAEGFEAGLASWAMRVSTFFLILGCVGILFRFRYELADTD